MMQDTTTVDIPASKMKKAIADILLNEGYVKNVEVIEDKATGYNPYNTQVCREQTEGSYRFEKGK